MASRPHIHPCALCCPQWCGSHRQSCASGRRRGRRGRPQTRNLSTCRSAVAVASVPQRTVLGVIRELEASAPVGLQARRRTLSRRRRRVLPVVAPADALGEVREVARRAVWLEHTEALKRGRPLRDWQRPAREWLAARVPIVLDRAPSVSAARCRRRAHAWSGVLAARLAQVVCRGAGISDPWLTPPRFGWPAVVALKGNSRSTKAQAYSVHALLPPRKPPPKTQWPRSVLLRRPQKILRSRFAATSTATSHITDRPPRT